MGERPPPPMPQGFYYNVLGISKSATLSEICKAYKTLVRKWHPDKNANRPEAVSKFRSINEAYRVLSSKKREENIIYEEEPTSPIKLPNSSKYDEDLVISEPTLLSRTGSMVNPRSPRSLSSRRNITATSLEFDAPLPNWNSTTPSTPSTPLGVPPISKATSRRTISTPIIFSQSTARRKPPPIERKLECTLEELLHGTTKNIKIIRDVLSDIGMIFQEEESLKIKVKPGWKKGTKITFEGKGDEKPGWLPADIVFVIDEKRHTLFKRQGDDLMLGVEIPLIQALTGCSIDIPLLEGDNVNLSFDEIIYPGYEKIIPGQGMRKSSKDSNQVTRGDLRLNFIIEFPTDLSDDQRCQVVDILSECC